MVVAPEILDALPGLLPRLIGPEYEQQCRTLCYGPFPSWNEVQARFNELRDVL